MRKKIQFRSAHVCPTIASAALTLCLLQSTESLAQDHTVSHYFNGNNMKSYSVAIQTDRTMPSMVPNPIQCVKAGTIYGNFGGGPIGLGTPAVVHFVRTNELGRITNSVYYDAGGYAEERAVSIVGNGASANATYYIVSLIRPFAGADDQIRIQAVDYTGQPVSNAAYIQATAGGGANYGSLHPLHAVYHNSQIYICGYITKDPAALYPGAPGFATPKESFVLSYSPATQTVTGKVKIQTVATTAVSDDYDMAMRLTPMSNGNLHVTGGVNALRSGGLITSGTMNIELSPALRVINEKNFAESQSPYHEYGVGFVETPGGQRYVVGNNFYRGTGGGFDIFPSRPWVNWVSSNPPTPLHPGTATSRFHFNDNFEYVWALQAMPGVGPDDVRIVGHQTWEKCNRGSTDQASPDNIQPFIADFRMQATFLGDVSGSSVGSGNDWTNYRNQTGTGSSGFMNSYWSLGRDLDVMAWNSTIAAREPGWGMVLTAAKWDAATNKLNFKSIRAEDNTLDIPTCTAEVNQCSNTFFITENVVTNICVTDTATFPVSIGIHALPAINLAFSSQVDCDNAAPQYRLGGSTLQDQASGVEVYPNPASDHISVSLGNDIKDDATVSIVLLNQYGQQIANLYNGNAKTLHNNYKLQLPPLASGMYMVLVNTGGNNVLHHKLTIHR